ncbi:MAG: hypothetical protein U0Z75_02440 [Deinococcaceae bacterium]
MKTLSVVLSTLALIWGWFTLLSIYGSAEQIPNMAGIFQNPNSNRMLFLMLNVPQFGVYVGLLIASTVLYFGVWAYLFKK